MGMGFGLSNAAAGGADALSDILKQKFLEQIQKQTLAQRAQEAQMQHTAQLRGQDITARGQDGVQNRWSTDRSDAQAAAATAVEKARADAEALQDYINSLPDHMKPVVAGKAKFGVTLTPQDLVEAPLNREDAQALRIKGVAAETETRERIQARYRPAPQPRDERLVQVEGPNGVPTWVRESDAVGKPAAQAARAVTGAERQALAYYNRAKAASDDIAPLEDQMESMGLAAQARLQYAPNILQTETDQRYRQAQRAFTEARLRKESGAAIPEGEYENDAKTYFRQPGDSKATLAQKRAARASVLEGLKFSSGRAYDEFYGQQPSGQPSGGQQAADPLGLRKK